MNIESILEDALLEIKRLISEQNRFSESFRNRYDHTMRVLHWARRIHAVEGGDLVVITLAVLFHDTGWSDIDDHALIGAELSEAFLSKKGVDPVLVRRISSAVSTHNKRQLPKEDLPLENQIVMDADILDEKGVITLVWDAMATANEEKPGYQRALERNRGFFNGAMANRDFLKTKTGSKLYNERIEMWQKCLDHFTYELGLSEVF